MKEWVLLRMEEVREKAGWFEFDEWEYLTGEYTEKEDNLRVNESWSISTRLWNFYWEH